MIINQTYPYITVTASISGSTMTVTNVVNGPIVLNGLIAGTGIPANVVISAGPSSGEAGVYTLSTYTQVSGFPVPQLIPANITLASSTLLATPWTLNCEQTIIAQYANSPILLQLINNMNAYIDPSAILFNFYSQIWNVMTAQGYGLDVWGRIVGVTRYFNNPTAPSWFNFRESGVGTPFGPAGSAPFFNGSALTSVYRLSDAQFLPLILVKALSNISLCSAQVLNQLLQNLFGAGVVYTQDLGGMKMQMNFTTLTQTNLAILINTKALPRPTGVMNYIYVGGVQYPVVY
jgi:hypothetical protein